jgi:hypothetical protein
MNQCINAIILFYKVVCDPQSDGIAQNLENVAHLVNFFFIYVNSIFHILFPLFFQFFVRRAAFHGFKKK